MHRFGFRGRFRRGENPVHTPAEKLILRRESRSTRSSTRTTSTQSTRRISESPGGADDGEEMVLRERLRSARVVDLQT